MLDNKSPCRCKYHDGDNPSCPIHSHNFKYSIETTTDLSKYEIIQIESDPFGKFFKSICDTKEAKVREGLIKLGWTPPVPDELIPKLAHRTCRTYKHNDETPYRFDDTTIKQFVRRLVEEAGRE